MKIRSDFVSNSSSSLFIVFQDTMKNEHELNMVRERFYSLVGTKKDAAIYCNRVVLPDPYIGEVQFGWDWKVYKTIGDKLNFAALQVAYTCFDDPEFSKRYNMLYFVVEELFDIFMFMFYLPPDINSVEMYYHFKCKEDPEYSVTPYIDHQSCARENQNVDIFESKETLKKFILSDSYIQGGNDNEDPPESYED